MRYRRVNKEWRFHQNWWHMFTRNSQKFMGFRKGRRRRANAFMIRCHEEARSITIKIRRKERKGSRLW